MNHSILLDTDSYKSSQFLQYAPKTEAMYSYFESRGGQHSQTVFFGLQYLLHRLTRRITVEDCVDAKRFWHAHGLTCFNFDGWLDIAQRLDGRLPVKIMSVPEGSVIPTGNLLMSAESTDERAFWVTGWLETYLVRQWYPITVATVSWHCKKIIKAYLEKTADDPKAELPFKLHDFGCRGVSSYESAAIGGAAHLVNFMGSDTVPGVLLANEYYDCDMAAFSIPAAEHSTITSWGKDEEVEAYRNMIAQFAKPGKLVAVVSDSYDIYRACDEHWGKTLKQDVINSGGTVIIRPDSGDPPIVVVKCLQILDRRFGSTTNGKGFKVLNHVRVIQGDGLDGPEEIEKILKAVTDAGFSASNVAFGMGGGLLQKIDRDTQKFAFKCSAVKVDGKWRDVFKQPVTDLGKQSKKGKLSLVPDGKGSVTTVQGQNWQDMLQTVYVNGEIKAHTTLAEVRRRAEEALD